MDIKEKLVKLFPEEKHVLKCLEECAELSEVLCKYLSRSQDKKPSLTKIAEEMGDVILRVEILAQKLGIGGSVNARIEEKKYILEEWLKEKYYE